MEDIIKEQDMPQVMHFAKLRSSAKSKGSIAKVVSLESTSTYTMENVMTALNSKNVLLLQAMSEHFFVTSGEYRSILLMLSNLLTFTHLFIPKIDETVNTKDKAFQDTYEKIMRYESTSAVEDVCRMITLSVLRDGLFVGYERENSEGFFLQRLPARFCQVRAKINGVYMAEFDLTFFEEEFHKAESDEEREGIIRSYPEELIRAYLAYADGKVETKWFILPPEHARVHLLNDSAIPLFASMFPDIISLEDYKNMNKEKTEKDLYNLVIQKIPLDKMSKISLNFEEVMSLHQNLKNLIVDKYTDVITTPCDVESLEFNKDDAAKTQADNLGKATNSLFNSSGVPQAMFNLGEKTNSTTLKVALKALESLLYPLLDQYEYWYNWRLSFISKKYQYFATFPQISIYTKGDMVKIYQQASNYGYPTKLLTLSALGVKQSQVEGLLNYENDFLKLPEVMIPTQSTYTQSSGSGKSPEEKKVGAPMKDEVTEEGEATRDGSKNEGQKDRQIT